MQTSIGVNGLAEIETSILASIKKTYSQAIKRIELSIKLEGHVTSQSFPADLNFKLGPYQLPNTIPEVKKDALRLNEEKILHTAKLEILNGRLKIIQEDVVELKRTLDALNSSDINCFKEQVKIITPVAASIAPIELGKLRSNVQLAFALYKQKDEQRRSFAASQQQTQPVAMDQENNADTSALLRRIDSLEKSLSQLNLQRSSRNQQPTSGPRNGNGRDRHRNNNNERGRSTSPTQSRRFHSSTHNPPQGRSRSPHPNPQSRGRGRGRGRQGRGNQEPQNRRRGRSNDSNRRY